jgi:hypothetical protein
MTSQELRDRLHGLTCACDINQRYHQCMSWRWRIADRVMKIAVALVACLALAAEFWGPAHHHYAIAFAAIAAFAAILLNVVPFGEIERFYDEMFHSWSELRADAEVQRTKAAETSGATPPHVFERFTELIAKMHSLNAREPAAYRGLMRRCQEDNNESVWGDGIRTSEQVAAERKRRATAPEASEGQPAVDR